METTPSVILLSRPPWCRQQLHRSAATLLAAFVGFAAVFPPTAVAATFQGLGDLTGGDFNSRVFDMTPDGAYVVGNSFSEFGEQAFKWSATSGMIGLGDLTGGSFRSLARGVSADGSVIVGSSLSTLGNPEAFRWTQATGMVGLGDLDGGTFQSEATAVSADGTVIVGEGHDGTANRAFRWTQATGMVSLDTLGVNLFSIAKGVSADGTVVVGDTNLGSGGEAFRWTATTGMFGLGDLPGGNFASNAVGGVSADGKRVAGQSTSALGSEAAVWLTGIGWIGLGDLDGGVYDSKARDISADGRVVVGDGNRDTNADRAFVWDATNGMRNVKQLLLAAGLAEVTNWELHAVTAISADGRIIAGDGRNPDGNTEAWIATVPGLFPLGDYNHNGTVDTADYVVWRNNFAEIVPPCTGPDANCNGFVENSDYLPWKSNFGLSFLEGASGAAILAGSPPAAIPEPSLALLMALGTTGLLCNSRARRHGGRLVARQR